MPIYEYQCDKCGHTFDHLAKSMASRDDAVECPECGHKKSQRKMSVFAVGASESAPASLPPMCQGCGRDPGSCGMR